MLPMCIVEATRPVVCTGKGPGRCWAVCVCVWCGGVAAWSEERRGREGGMFSWWKVTLRVKGGISIGKENRRHMAWRCDFVEKRNKLCELYSCMYHWLKSLGFPEPFGSDDQTHVEKRPLTQHLENKTSIKFWGKEHKIPQQLQRIQIATAI